MKVIKLLGHNAALVEDEKGRRGIVTGQGVAFNKSIGECIDEEKIEKLYIEYTPEVQKIIHMYL